MIYGPKVEICSFAVDVTVCHGALAHSFSWPQICMQFNEGLCCLAPQAVAKMPRHSQEHESAGVFAVVVISVPDIGLVRNFPLAVFDAWYQLRFR